MGYRNLKPGTRGLLRAFRAQTMYLGHGTKYVLWKGKKLRSLNTAEARSRAAKSIRESKKMIGHKDTKRIILHGAAGIRRRKGLKFTP